MKLQSLSSILLISIFYLAFSNTIQANANPLLPIKDSNNRNQHTGISLSNGNPDSIGAALGHCNPITFAVVNCLTHTIELSAFISWTFTGQLEPMVVTWSTGEVAHKITVTPPGLWNWDASFTSCEPNHWDNNYDQPGTFFTGNLEVLGPDTICTGSAAELTVQSGGYQFPDFTWNPANPGGNISPYVITAPGIYTLSVTDQLGCPFSDQITITSATSALSVHADDLTLCMGETANIAPGVSGGLPDYKYLWNTGETTASISPTTSGTYTLNVVDGCGATAAVSVDLIFQSCGCVAETFIKTIGEAGVDVHGYAVYDSKDGNLYITGLKQDSAVIIKMTPGGSILWMRALDRAPGVRESITELMVDSDGMLVGVGQIEDFTPGPWVKEFAFRYDPATDNMLWFNTYELKVLRVLGVMELPNGNYLIYDNPSNDNRMLEINRVDGAIDFNSPLTQKLHFNGPAWFNSTTIHNGKLYGVGTYRNGGINGTDRNALSRIDLATGTVDWTHLSHVPLVQATSLKGVDLFIEDNHIISVSCGSEVANSLNQSKIYLQKTSLDGDIIWAKRFDIPETADNLLIVEEVISVPDGFILYGSSIVTLDSTDIYLLKTDKDGELQWAKKVDYDLNDFMGWLPALQSQILLKDGHLFFMATTSGQNVFENQMLLTKTTLDGALEGNCDFIKPALVDASAVINPANSPVIVQETPFNETNTSLSRVSLPTSLLVENHCKVYINEQVNFSLCPGKSVTISGITYTQATEFIVETPGVGGCDTIRTYIIETLPYQTRAEDLAFCPGGSVTIGGQVYDQPGTVVDTIAAVNGCDTIVTYTLSVSPYQTRSENISFCPGQSVVLGGQVYSQAGIVIDTLSSATSCDTIVTYTLSLLPYQIRSENISFCPGQSVVLGGQVYTQAGIVTDTISSTTACDTIVTYTLNLLPYQTRSENIAFCPGQSVTIGGQVYNQSGIVTDTISSANACDTIVTYTLTLLPNQTRSETISFCLGETITLGGVPYTQPGTVVLTLPSANSGCDTVVTYTLQSLTPAPSNVSIVCPNAITVSQPNGGPAVVNYNLPAVASDCPCPGISLARTSGLASGSNFPQGVTSVCYTAQDSCGQSNSCCFNVAVVMDDEPCDIKTNGCIKYELLTITEDPAKNRTYRVRVTNSCANKMLYTNIQVPNGIVAMEPANLSIYTAPSGNTYRVRSQNLTGQNSVRFKSISDSISNGESDIFKYTLPAQASVTFIHVVSRLEPNIFLEAHLNTFFCPIGITAVGDQPNEGRQEEKDVTPFKKLSHLDELLIFPNPASQLVRVETGGQAGELILQDAMGRVLLRKTVENPETEISVERLPQGLYQLVFVGERTMLYGSLVVQH